MAATCFVCNIERAEFDRRGSGFDHHQANDHNTWNYMWLLAYLRFLDPTEMNGAESYIAKKIAMRDNSWIPVQRAMCLEGAVDDADEGSPASARSVQALGRTLSDLVGGIRECKRELGRLRLSVAQLADGGGHGPAAPSVSTGVSTPPTA
jgi:hypothetical protein